MVLRVGVVDIGTNTVRLLIAERMGAVLKTLERDQVVTGLGRGVDRGGRISEEGAKRTLAVLGDYAQRCREAKVRREYVTGSAVLRDAADGGAFCRRVKEETALDVAVISGEEEAELAYWGVASARERVGPLVVVDLGGGSTELVFGDGLRVGFRTSIDIGSVRMTERFLKSEPPAAAEIEELTCFVSDSLAGETARAKEKVGAGPLGAGVFEVAGVGGTITTLQAIRMGLAAYDRDKIHGSVLTVADLDKIFDELVAMPLEKRKSVVGLQPERADVIVAGLVIAREVLKALGATEMTVSEADLLDGLALKAAGFDFD